METRGQQARLDQHEEQLQQLQADVSEIKSVLKTLEGDRAEEEEFRKLVMSWAKQQGKQPTIETGGPSMVSGNPPVIPTPNFPTPLMGGVQTPLVGNDVSMQFPQHHSGATPQHGGPFVFGPPLGISHGFPWAAKKVKLPEFSGFDPRGWITKAELFFEIHGTHPTLRIGLAQLSMSGVAQHWFSVVKGIYDPLSWDQLKQELLQRFSGLEIQNPYEQLSTIQQVSSIYDYIDDFEYLLSLVPRLPESQAFLNHKRWTRLDAMYLAKDVEEMLNPSDHSALTARYRYQFPSHNSAASLPGSLMHPGGQHVSTNHNPFSNVDRHLLVSGSGQNRFEGFTDPPGSISVDKGTSPRLESSRSPSMSRSPSLTSVESSSVGGRNRGFRSLTRTEWEERRKKGLCFRCGQIFGPAHKCPEGSMRVLLLADDEHLDAEGAIRAMDAWEEAGMSKIRVPDTSLEDKTLIAGGRSANIVEICGPLILKKSSLLKDIPANKLPEHIATNFSVNGISHAGLLSSVVTFEDNIVISDADGQVVLKYDKTSESMASFEFSEFGVLGLPYWLVSPMESAYAAGFGIPGVHIDHIQHFSLLPGRINIQMTVEIPQDTELVEPLDEGCIWRQTRGTATEVLAAENKAESTEKVGVAQQFYDDLDGLASLLTQEEVVDEEDDTTSDAQVQDGKVRIDCVVNTSPGTSEVIINAALYLRIKNEIDESKKQQAGRLVDALNHSGNDKMQIDACAEIVSRSEKNPKELIFVRPLHVRLKINSLDHPKADNSKDIILTESSIQVHVSLN
ncbi:hypothetical protein OSB04_020552 [Centaurea solstitialis]|uniref:Retrotransposon gag domain-containing protein n=1 Tax=Centaurea solstitialis TaxID=347529 RepID=A0AA38SSG2_9ASTR|nr:hypothetical protein OSB04_020552 [Centaurea solstitialis]